MFDQHTYIVFAMFGGHVYHQTVSDYPLWYLHTFLAGMKRIKTAFSVLSYLE
jgi:hypothetical protein